jgi:uncharacterized membrane protein YdjX (TVP38/TMEM64 family)
MERQEGHQPRAKKSRQRIVILVLFLVVFLLVVFWGLDFLTLENIQKNQSEIKKFVKEHPAVSVTSFILLYITTAFFVPGALLLTLVAGFVFGVLSGTLYVIIGDTLGCVAAFLLSRYLIGNWVQEKFEGELRAFNRDIALHGHNYLFALRVLPILPSFLINYLAGLTRISIKTFALTTSLGSLPGAAVYTFAGQKLGEVRRLEDVFSAEMILVFILLGVLAVLPVGIKYFKKTQHQ